MIGRPLRYLALALAALAGAVFATVSDYVDRSVGWVRRGCTYAGDAIVEGLSRLVMKMPRLEQLVLLPLSRVQIVMREYVLHRQPTQKPLKRPTWALCPST